jgi:hypothetical protein
MLCFGMLPSGVGEEGVGSLPAEVDVLVTPEAGTAGRDLG